jgi:hypothetical protein
MLPLKSIAAVIHKEIRPMFTGLRAQINKLMSAAIPNEERENFFHELRDEQLIKFTGA